MFNTHYKPVRSNYYAPTLGTYKAFIANLEAPLRSIRKSCDYSNRRKDFIYADEKRPNFLLRSLRRLLFFIRRLFSLNRF